MSNARLPDRQLKAASNVSHELGELSPAERDFLARLDCDVLQGYLFSKPLPFEEIVGYLLARR